ncbi:uncharacterized protein LOC129787691 isoform X1 [Lutzomyia longipalpis]|uniref:uncharacterized protein LOC129787691 isoform X1 n=1 Tax=Lutzomyia longipalpis TaxID=7200 RepID=UPI0024834693|nr:uncharacterized protein LOC129787691 isoform X1 [Lutzomyia longipalpis]
MSDCEDYSMDEGTGECKDVQESSKNVVKTVETDKVAQTEKTIKSGEPPKIPKAAPAKKRSNKESMENWRVRSPANTLGTSSGHSGSWRSRNVSERSEPTRKDSYGESNFSRNWRGQEYSTRFPQGMSKRELLTILQMDPVDLFLEILDNGERFIKTTLREGKSYEDIVILICIIGKLHESPLRSHLEEFVSHIFGQETIFRDDILAYVRYAVDLEEQGKVNKIPLASEVWDNLETFCSYAKKIRGNKNCWAYFTRSICQILAGKTKESLSRKYSKFLKLQQELERNYFYQETIYATVNDANEERKYKLKRENGKFADAKEYLDFQIEYHKRCFLSRLQPIIKVYNTLKIKYDEMNEAPMIKISKNYIFPRVVISEPQKEVNERLFVLDLLPYFRGRSDLSDEFQEEVSNYVSIFSRSSLLFLSTTNSFTDIIVVHSPSMENDMEKLQKSGGFRGYLKVNILRMENIHENIFERYLFLVKVRNDFEPKLPALQYLENMSTAILPFKEYLVDECESTDTIERDISLEQLQISDENSDKNDFHRLNLNEKQREAFKMALKRKLSVIQGPAGTGKSVVTLNIIENILKTTSSQIVVITYSIPSLDTFLMRCSKLTDKIVRIGYSSRNEEVKAMELYYAPCRDPRWKRLRKQAGDELISAICKFTRTIKHRGFNRESSDSKDELLKNLRHADLKQWEMTPLRMYYRTKNARIIGFTTTGTGKYHQLMELLRPSIVIIEEAAILPESHLITSLTEYTEQIILVGDVMQMTHIRELSFPIPPPNESQFFDRMVRRNLNNIRLNVQYRMHTDIADLVRTQEFYTDLVDGENVKEYQPIRGIAKNVYCINKTEIEGLDEQCEVWIKKIIIKKILRSEEVDDDDKKNFHLILFCIGLANFLRLQGYKSDEVMILTNDDYVQYFKIFISFMKSDLPLLEGINVSSKYMFRGQECRIVILCLLNDGPDNKYLSRGPHCPITLLTRAREGLFIVENVLNILEKKEKDEDEEEDEDNDEDEKKNYWAKVKTVLEKKNAIGTGLPIKCEKHGSEIIAKSFGDFMDFTKKGCAIGKNLPQTFNYHPCFDVVADEN